MYKSKYANLMQNLMNEHDLILLDSEQQEIEKWVDKDLKAVNYTRCCKSDSEQLVCDVDYLHNFTKGAKYLCKPDGLKHFEVEDDFGSLYKLHRKLFKKTE